MKQSIAIHAPVTPMLWRPRRMTTWFSEKALSPEKDAEHGRAGLLTSFFVLSMPTLRHSPPSLLPHPNTQ